MLHAFLLIYIKLTQKQPGLPVGKTTFTCHDHNWPIAPINCRNRFLFKQTESFYAVNLYFFKTHQIFISCGIERNYCKDSKKSECCLFLFFERLILSNKAAYGNHSCFYSKVSLELLHKILNIRNGSVVFDKATTYTDCGRTAKHPRYNPGACSDQCLFSITQAKFLQQYLKWNRLQSTICKNEHSAVYGCHVYLGFGWVEMKMIFWTLIINSKMI